MKDFAVGFARVNITPPLGIPVSGYYQVRLANQILDELEANAVAFAVGDAKAVLISIDVCTLFQIHAEPLRREIAEAAGLTPEAVLLHCTHTHTGPEVNLSRRIAPPIQEEYFTFFRSRLRDAAVLALQDLKPAHMGWAVGHAPNIAFIRRFRMKDGSSRTNPGVNNPDIDSPIGSVDDRVGVVRFDREGGPAVILANIGIHPDTVGGCVISADWPGFFRRTLEKTLDDTRCVFLNGAEGDVNHVNVSPEEGQLNDLTMDFDDVMRGYGHARHMGWTVAGAVLQVLSKVRHEPVDSLRVCQRVMRYPSNMPAAEELPLARRYNALHQAGRDDEIPYEGMMLTTVVAEAERMLQLEHGPEYFDLNISALSVGPVALVGMPGEPFTAVGRTLKDAPGWSLVLPCCLTNGNEGYFPTMDAYQEGGYEARSSIFRPGVAEAMASTGLDMLSALRPTDHPA
ncbi:MAG: hypothetical protein ACI4MJ_04025 [Aristaeellaceae bacterium]